VVNYKQNKAKACLNYCGDVRGDSICFAANSSIGLIVCSVSRNACACVGLGSCICVYLCGESRAWRVGAVHPFL